MQGIAGVTRLKKVSRMFYRPENGHGLPHNPFKAIVAPRPIGWISTRGNDGHDNLAPYSFFNAVADNPPQVVFSSTGRKEDRDDTKDSVSHIRETGVFAVNIVSRALSDAMNISSGPWEKTTDEFAKASLEKADCETIACSRVVAAPATLECTMTKIIQLEGPSNYLVIGKVTGVHITSQFLRDGILDVKAYQPLARLGYKDYAAVTETFSLNRPNET